MFNRWFKNCPQMDYWEWVVVLLGGGAAGFSASGGDVDALAPGNGTYHTFTTSGAATLDFANAEDLSTTIIGGGGGWIFWWSWHDLVHRQAVNWCWWWCWWICKWHHHYNRQWFFECTRRVLAADLVAHMTLVIPAFDVGNGSNSSAVFLSRNPGG